MKQINHLIQYFVILVLFFLFKFLGYRISSNVGFIIGKFLGPIFRSKNPQMKVF